MKKPSLTVYITIWYAAFMLILLAVFVAVIVNNNSNNSIRNSKENIQEEITDLFLEKINFSEGDFRLDSDISYFKNAVYLSVYNEEGRILAGRTPVFVGYLPEFEDKQLFREKNEETGTYWYILDNSFKDKNGNTVWVRGISENQDTIGLTDSLSRGSKWIIGSLILVAIVGGFVISRNALRPIRRLTRTAEKIRDDGDLSIRIDTGRRRDEISDLAEAFNSMFERLQSMIKKEKQFTSDVSHELRTPLAVIQSTSDFAMQEEDFRGEALLTINKEARRMNNLVSRLLTLSRSDAGRMPLNKESVNLSELCEKIADQQRLVLSEEDISVNTAIEEDVCAECDEGFIIRAVLNLMDNAAEYGIVKEETEEGTVRHGSISISLHRDGDNAVIRVTDDGPGVPEEHIDRIWDRFYRADTVRNDRGSSGLGLSMVKAIAENHGGSVSVRNKEDGGAEFEIRIPL